MNRLFKYGVLIASIAIFIYSIVLFQVSIDTEILHQMQQIDPSLEITNSIVFITIYNSNQIDGQLIVYNILLLFSVVNLILAALYFKSGNETISQLAVLNAIFFMIVSLGQTFFQLPGVYMDANGTIVKSYIFKILISSDAYTEINSIVIPNVVVPIAAIIILGYLVSMIFSKPQKLT